MLTEKVAAVITAKNYQEKMRSDIDSEWVSTEFSISHEVNYGRYKYVCQNMFIENADKLTELGYLVRYSGTSFLDRNIYNGVEVLWGEEKKAYLKTQDEFKKFNSWWYKPYKFIKKNAQEYLIVLLIILFSIATIHIVKFFLPK